MNWRVQGLATALIALSTAQPVSALSPEGAVPTGSAARGNTDNRHLAHRYFEVFAKHEVLTQPLAAKLFTEDLVLHDPGMPEPLRGRDAFVEAIAMLGAAFPDYRYTLEQVVVEGNTVVMRWTMRGTQKGEFFGVAPTGRQVTMTGVDFLQFSQGKIKEIRVLADFLGLMQQLGVVRLPQSGSKTGN